MAHRRKIYKSFCWLGKAKANFLYLGLWWWIEVPDFLWRHISTTFLHLYLNRFDLLGIFFPTVIGWLLGVVLPFSSGAIFCFPLLGNLMRPSEESDLANASCLLVWLFRGCFTLRLDLMLWAYIICKMFSRSPDTHRNFGNTSGRFSCGKSILKV